MMFALYGCGKEQKPENQNKQEKLEDNPDIVDEEQQIQEVEEDKSSSSNSDVSQQARSVCIYYVDEQTAEVAGKNIEIHDEYDIWAALKENGLLTEECELLSLNVNEDEKKIDLDFNAATGERIRSMGTTGEIQIIGCIINTYLEAYGCESIRLTEEGQVLQTSHGANFDGYSGEITFGVGE